jgi:hypothetical protein
VEVQLEQVPEHGGVPARDRLEAAHGAPPVKAVLRRTKQSGFPNGSAA